MSADQRVREFRLVGRHQYCPHPFERIEAHPRRAATREKAKHHLFPEMLVSALLADLAKLAKTLSYLFTAYFVVPLDGVDGDRFGTSLHCGFCNSMTVSRPWSINFC